MRDDVVPGDSKDVQSFQSPRFRSTHSSQDSAEQADEAVQASVDDLSPDLIKKYEAVLAKINVEM